METTRRLIFILIAILAAQALHAQVTDSLVDSWEHPKQKPDTVVRFLKYANDSFAIVYRFNKSMYFDTLVARVVQDSTGKIDIAATNKLNERNLHYYAEVQVYKVKKGKRVHDYKPVWGKYVPATCWEDIPETYVENALK